MVGPDPYGMGGISRVVKIWQNEGWLCEQGIKYIPSASDSASNKFVFLLKGLFKFIPLCLAGYRGVYIHTASRNSFYRKTLFITIGYLFRKKPVPTISANSPGLAACPLSFINSTYPYCGYA